MKTKTKQSIISIKELDINPVRDFLEKRQNDKLSVNTISKHLNIKRNHVKYFANTSNHIRRIKPHEVGSYKYSIDVFTYQ